jgi:RNA polymerase primary sigma factor
MTASTAEKSESVMRRKAPKGPGARLSHAPKRGRKTNRRGNARGRGHSKVRESHEHRSLVETESPEYEDEYSSSTALFDADEIWSHRSSTPANDETNKASFLSKYFRDMSALDILRPEEEFVAARRIEDLEISLWEQFFSYPPVVGHILQVVEHAQGRSLSEFRSLRRAADVARKSNTKSVRAELANAARRCAVQLHAADADRIYAQAVMAELGAIQRGAASEFAGGRIRFSIKSRLFLEYLARVDAADRMAAEARNDFVRANLRLVVSIARRFNHGRMAIADLIQEGNIGLMKAVERYDYRRGFRFSTYASWWIRHAISRALADKGREIRLPVHMLDAHHKLSKARRELTFKLGRKPTNDELGYACDIPADKVEKMRGYLTDRSYSLDRPVNDEDGRPLIEFLDDPDYDDHAMTDELHIQALAQAAREALHELKPIEAEILKQRFGLDSYDEHTLKQIGEKYNLSRERIRQLQEEALAKVRHVMYQRRLSMQ